MKFISLSFTLILSLLSWSWSLGQSPITINDEASGLGVYQVYLGKLAPGASLDQFANVSHLGFLRTFSLAEKPVVQGPSRSQAELPVFLGPFLGEATANQVLAEVQAKGYDFAYIEQGTEQLVNEDGMPLVYSVQLGAFQEPNMKRFQKIANIPAYGVLVMYENGYYKVMSGLYRQDQESYLREEVIPYFAKNWNLPGFLKILPQGF